VSFFGAPVFVLASTLFALGIFGFLTRPQRDHDSDEHRMMLNAANLTFLAAARGTANANEASSYAIFHQSTESLRSGSWLIAKKLMSEIAKRKNPDRERRKRRDRELAAAARRRRRTSRGGPLEQDDAARGAPRTVEGMRCVIARYNRSKLLPLRFRSPIPTPSIFTGKGQHDRESRPLRPPRLE